MVSVSLFALACTTTHHVERPTQAAVLQSMASEGSTSVIYTPPAGTEVAEPVASTQRLKSLPSYGYAQHPTDLVGYDSVDLRLRGVWIGNPANPTYVRLGDVRSIEVRRHGRGAIEGLGLGLLSGVVVGALGGYVTGDDPSRQDLNEDFSIRFTRNENALVWGIIGGGLGGLLGLLVGAISGHVDRYEF